MAAPALVESDMQLGKDVYSAISEDKVLKPRAILWLFDDDAHEWRLIISTDDAKSRGPQAAYLRVRSILKKANLLDRIPLNRIVVTTPDNPLLATIGSMIRTGDEGPNGLSFYDCTFNYNFVSGMYVYRLNLP